MKQLLKDYANGKIDLICILGPTASGKTRYAVQLAREINKLLKEDPETFGPSRTSHILSADSRQVYRGMSIGTGKDLKEYEEIPYHLIDIVDAGEKYNIFEYQRDFEKAYKTIVDQGGIPILCGGSGLYIEAATCGYSLPEVPPCPELRAELEKEETEVLISRLSALKSTHNTSDFDSRKRLIRALEIAMYEAEHPVNRTSFLPKKTYYIGIDVDRDTRNALIDKRLDTRIEEGMIEEVRSLLDSGIPAEDLIYYGLEYKFITLHLSGELTLSEMKNKLAIAIHQFAKRQMTWFRKMEKSGIQIHWK